MNQVNMPEYNQAQLQLLIHALELLDGKKLYELGDGWDLVHKHLLEIFRKLLKPETAEIKKEYRWNKTTGELLGTFHCDKPMGDYETNVKPPKGLTN